MCMGCMGNADFIVTSGILGVASARIGARRFLSTPGRWTRKVTDDEAAEFVASLDACPVEGETAPEPSTEVAPVGPDSLAEPDADLIVDDEDRPRITASLVGSSAR